MVRDVLARSIQVLIAMITYMYSKLLALNNPQFLILDEPQFMHFIPLDVLQSGFMAIYLLILGVKKYLISLIIGIL